ncbi:MAG: hypothetical protein K8W52_21300 [Deltaproteobacteria bacterium]|nr:hypothetical protein [Deltaproteobacteria bacterium]
MDTLIDSIRAAITDGATDDTKRAGANACRAILAALDSEPATALAAPAPAIHANLIGALGRMDLNQLLDVAIARLRALNASNSNAPPTPSRGVAIPLVPIPRGAGAS